MKSLIKLIGVVACVALVTWLFFKLVPGINQPAPQVSVASAIDPGATVALMLSGPNGQMYPVMAEIAFDDASRERGLMGRTSLDSGRGMLFMFPNEQNLSFWMKNTLIPLDVLFFNHVGEFVSGSSMVPCAADPCVTYSSVKPAMFALEIPAGEMARLGITQDWRLDGTEAPLW
jgi:uncharacterized membrane protein (UPF0127 family)